MPQGLDLALLWLWCRPAAVALAWELLCATGGALKKKGGGKKRKKDKKKIKVEVEPGLGLQFHFLLQLACECGQLSPL